MSTPFNEFLGTRLISREPGRCVVALDLEPHHANRRGVAHGGVVSSVLDSAMGGAVVSTMTAEEWCATMQLSVTFVDGPRAGSTITATGRVVRRGRRVAFAEGTLVDPQGRTLATAQGVWYIWPTAPGG